ncbi:unnamed protein product, partial [Allacma fusca]
MLVCILARRGPGLKVNNTSVSTPVAPSPNSMDKKKDMQLNGT